MPTNDALGHFNLAPPPEKLLPLRAITIESPRAGTATFIYESGAKLVFKLIAGKNVIPFSLTNGEKGQWQFVFDAHNGGPNADE